jgi:RNA polymerase sigma-70 factor (ECF subfamily)
VNAEGKLIPFRRLPAVAVADPGDQISDQALVAACAVGDTAALGVLFDRHHRGVYAFLSRLAGTDERDLDDLVQATFLAALRSAKRFRGDAPVHRWLFGIAAHVVRHHVRSEIRRKSFHVRLAEHPSRRPTEPGEKVERDMMLAKVRQAVDELPHKQKVVYIMCELEEMPGVEVARVLDMREGTVWRLLHQARVALRAALERRER